MRLDKKAIDKTTRGAVQKVGDQLERQLNGLSRSMENEPIDEIKREIGRAFRSTRGSITDTELTKYAETIQSGKTISFVAK